MGDLDCRSYVSLKRLAQYRNAGDLLLTQMVTMVVVVVVVVCVNFIGFVHLNLHTEVNTT